jgi:N-acetylneuraminate synthase
MRDYCKKRKIMWFASCWDKDSVDFIDKFNPPCYKISSASLTDDELLSYTKSKGKPILLSTGMSTMKEIEHAVKVLGGDDNLVIYHCTSTYPTDNNEINLKVINQLQEKFECPIGYSGHERGVTPSVMAVTIGANSVERHITTDRTLWGSDQAASLEPNGLFRMVRDIKLVPKILGNGKKCVYDSEKPIIKKLRRVK